MSDTKKVGLVFEAWKKPIYLRHLEGAGFTPSPSTVLQPGTLVMTVDTDEPQRLFDTVKAANTEAATTQKGSPHAN